jgi:small-conductance mechanosensitive channel
VILAIGYLAAGILAGLVFSVLLLPALESRLRPAWAESGGAALHSAGGPVLVLLAVAGATAADRVAPLDPDVGQAIRLVLAALAVMAVAWFVAALSRRLALAALAHHGTLPNATLFGNLAWVTAIALGGLIALGTVGVSITPLLTALGVGGLAVALALQPTLTNLFAGIQILGSGQLRPGDYVRLAGGEEGYVADVTWRQATIRALSNNIIVVPNAQLASSVLINYHQPEREMSVLVAVGVAYDSDLEHVERVTREVGREVLQSVPGGVAEFEPLVRYHTFGDSSIQFNVILRAHEYVDQYLLRHEFIKRLQRRYRDEGIVIPFPMRTVILENGDQAAPNGDGAASAPGAPTADGAGFAPGAPAAPAGGPKPSIGGRARG